MPAREKRSRWIVRIALLAALGIPTAFAGPLTIAADSFHPQTHFEKWVKEIMWRYAYNCESETAFDHPGFPGHFRFGFVPPADRTLCLSRTEFVLDCDAAHLIAQDTFRPSVLLHPKDPAFPPDWLIVGGQSLRVSGVVYCAFAPQGSWAQAYPLPVRRQRLDVTEDLWKFTTPKPWEGILPTGWVERRESGYFTIRTRAVVIRR